MKISNHRRRAKCTRENGGSNRRRAEERKNAPSNITTNLVCGKMHSPEMNGQRNNINACRWWLLNGVGRSITFHKTRRSPLRPPLYYHAQGFTCVFRPTAVRTVDSALPRGSSVLLASVFQHPAASCILRPRSHLNRPTVLPLNGPQTLG